MICYPKTIPERVQLQPNGFLSVEYDVMSASGDVLATRNIITELTKPDDLMRALRSDLAEWARLHAGDDLKALQFSLAAFTDEQWRGLGF